MLNMILLFCITNIINIFLWYENIPIYLDILTCILQVKGKVKGSRKIKPFKWLWYLASFNIHFSCLIKKLIYFFFNLLTTKNASTIPLQSMAKIKEKVLLITGSNSCKYDRPRKHCLYVYEEAENSPFPAHHKTLQLYFSDAATIL